MQIESAVADSFDFDRDWITLRHRDGRCVEFELANLEMQFMLADRELDGFLDDPAKSPAGLTKRHFDLLVHDFDLHRTSRSTKQPPTSESQQHATDSRQHRVSASQSLTAVSPQFSSFGHARQSLRVGVGHALSILHGRRIGGRRLRR